MLVGTSRSTTLYSSATLAGAGRLEQSQAAHRLKAALHQASIPRRQLWTILIEPTGQFFFLKIRKQLIKQVKQVLFLSAQYFTDLPKFSFPPGASELSKNILMCLNKYKWVTG